MITNSDIKKLKTIFATKEDLKKFATKEDLKRFASKNDLKTHASKKDLEKYVTVVEFRSAINELVTLISNGFSRIDQVLSSLKIHDDILNNHEHRLDKIEDKVLQSN